MSKGDCFDEINPLQIAIGELGREFKHLRLSFIKLQEENLVMKLKLSRLQSAILEMQSKSGLGLCHESIKSLQEGINPTP